MEEREQKTVAQATDHPKGDKLEAEGLSGVQTFMEITEDRLVEVQIDEQHLLELIVSPYNISRAIRKVMSNRPFALAIHAWGLVSGGSERHRRPPPALPAHVCSLFRHPLAGGGMSPHPATSALLGSVSGQKKRFFVPNATELQYLDKISRYVSQGNPSLF
ncbi:MAG: hypothetical protein IJU74_00720 [Bacteroidales bacterium]|nr:hypothetical protein [Bacteroidales bacterium]